MHLLSEWKCPQVENFTDFTSKLLYIFRYQFRDFQLQSIGFDFSIYCLHTKSHSLSRIHCVNCEAVSMKMHIPWRAIISCHRRHKQTPIFGYHTFDGPFRCTKLRNFIRRKTITTLFVNSMDFRKWKRLWFELLCRFTQFHKPEHLNVIGSFRRKQ